MVICQAACAILTDFCWFTAGFFVYSSSPFILSSGRRSSWADRW